MNYSKFKKVKNAETLLLKALGIIDEKKIIIKINNYPDFSLTNYDKFSLNTLFFEYEWRFSHIFKSIIDCEIINTKVFHCDDIERLADEYSIEYYNNEEPLLNEIYLEYPDLMCYEGFDTKFEGFKLNSLEISSIENNDKKIIFSGVYQGDSFSIEPVDWNIYAECELLGVLNNEGAKFFYQELLSEAYTQKKHKNFKMSFFLVFSALENYINETMNTHDTQKRLKDIINELFKKLPIPLNKNQIYNSIINDYSDYEAIRNSIAHGRGKLNILESELNQFILFTLIFIASAKGLGATFSDLFESIQ